MLSTHRQILLVLATFGISTATASEGGCICKNAYKVYDDPKTKLVSRLCTMLAAEAGNDEFVHAVSGHKGSKR